MPAIEDFIMFCPDCSITVGINELIHPEGIGSQAVCFGCGAVFSISQMVWAKYNISDELMIYKVDRHAEYYL